MGLNETLNSTDSVVINPVNSVSSSSTISNNSADDELTNLTWLQDNNLLQNMTHNDIISSDSSTKLTNQKEDNENVSPSKPSLNKDHIKEVDLKNNTIITSSGATLPCSVPPVKYNPHLHTQTKPPYSFSSLIFMAIESSPCKALPVKEIYNWITKNFPYYEKVPEGWKNTVRHNLSLNKCFKKIEKGSKVLANADGEDKKLLDEQLASKGSLWCVDQNLRPNLLQSIKRTPAHIYPYMSTAKEGTNLVQIGNAISDNQPNVNTITTVSIGNNNISPSNNLVNQSPKKVIALEKLPQKNILTTKRILIPITKVGQAGREAEEADAAESMLTLTQCSTAGALNNGNIFILTNKGNSLVPIQLNSITPKPVATVVTNKQQPVINKNPIAIITRPILTANASTSHPTIIQPTITKIQSINKQPTTAATATKASPINAINVSQLSTDHNYFSRASSVKTINSVNNVITIPASCLASGQKIFVNRTTANNATTNFIPIASNNLVNSNKTVNKIITITTNPTNQVTKTTQIPITKNIIIKSPVKSPAKAAIVEKKTTTGDKKRKSDSNDELMKMGAEALFNLANGTVKSTKASDKSKETGKQTEGNKNEKTPSKTRTITIHNVTSTVASSTPSTTTLTRSAAKKLKTTS